MRKLWKTLMLAGILTGSMSITALAGQWQKNETGWRYEKDDGSNLVNVWEWIDGNTDGIAECYYFDGSGYCLINTMTPDGYTVDLNGAWTIDGQVQTRTVETALTTNVSAEIQTVVSVSESLTVSMVGELPKGTFVWLSATGKKYHKIPDCGRMNPDNARSVTVEEAIQRGFGACDKCY